MIVREDSMTLYGFADGEARDLFSTLLGVSGVGPKIALATLAVYDATALRQALAALRKGGRAGFGDTVPLPELRRRGRIMRVMVREDSALNEMDSGLVTIWEDRHPVADTMPFERRVYASALQFWLGSDTVAELDQNLADTGGVAYDCEDVMQAALYASAIGIIVGPIPLLFSGIASVRRQPEHTDS
jgi:hypothetical protein